MDEARMTIDTQTSLRPDKPIEPFRSVIARGHRYRISSTSGAHFFRVLLHLTHMPSSDYQFDPELLLVLDYGQVYYLADRAPDLLVLPAASINGHAVKT